MTGLSAEDNYLYLGSTTQNKAYRYTLPSIVSRTEFTTFTGCSVTRDIVKIPYSLDLIWVASDNPLVPLACFNASGVRVDEITFDQVPAARGLAMDPSGNSLWVSDPVNDLLYEIEVTLSLENNTWGALKTAF